MHTAEFFKFCNIEQTSGHMRLYYGNNKNEKIYSSLNYTYFLNVLFPSIHTFSAMMYVVDV
jgi:hypothetical protein